MELKELFEMEVLDEDAILRVCSEIENAPKPGDDISDWLCWSAYVREWGECASLISSRLKELYDRDTADSMKLLYRLSGPIFGCVAKLQVLRRAIIGRNEELGKELKPILVFRPVSYEDMIRRLCQLDPEGKWHEKI